MSSQKGVSGGLRLKKNFFLILASLVIAFIKTMAQKADAGFKNPNAAR